MSGREKDKCKSDLKWKASFTCGPLNDSTVPRWTAEANYSGECALFWGMVKPSLTKHHLAAPATLHSAHAGFMSERLLPR